MGSTAIMAYRTLRLVSALPSLPSQLTPAIGELRFQPPQDVQWNDTTWNASAHVPVCIQQEDPLYTTGYGTSEDCLYLSIRTPAVLPDEPIPVMIWL